MAYSAFAMIGNQQVKCLPAGQPTLEDAKAQADAINSHFLQFPGGTQSIKIWVEED